MVIRVSRVEGIMCCFVVLLGYELCDGMAMRVISFIRDFRVIKEGHKAYFIV